MMERSEIKSYAKAALKANYWPSVGALVLITMVISAAGSVTFFLGGLGSFFMMPLFVGLNFFMLSTYRGVNIEIGGAFSNSFSNYGRKLGGMLWMALWTWLWSLLFIVPGIIKSLAYSMAPYILGDCPNVTATDALKLSIRMTQGHKGKIFVMGLSFIGWMMLSSLTFGILYVFYVGPYMSIAYAGLYEDLKRNAIAMGVIAPNELA